VAADRAFGPAGGARGVHQRPGVGGQHARVGLVVACCAGTQRGREKQAPYSALERRAAQWQAASKRARFALFVVVDPCRLPTLSDHIHRCELFGIPEEAARTRFREFMAAPVPSAAIGFPGTVSAVANVPIRVPLHFMGRDEALADIETALIRNHGRVAITALHGLRGVGKTTLAAAYADRHRAGYRATWWIRAQTESTIRAGLVALGIRLGWVSTDDKKEPALGAVMERLRHEGEGILLIFDNAIDVDSLRPYLPRGGLAKVLVTSNSHAWREVAEAVEIRIWRKEIGADYLMARAGRTSERAAAEALSEALGGLPLAHAQAAAFCEWLGVSFADYLKRFEASPVQLLDDPHYAPADYYDGRTVAKTFALAIAEAQKRHPAAEPLILYSALLAPEPIPLFLYFEAREELREPLTTALADNGLDEAIAVLRAFSLVDLETIENERDALIKTTAIRLHRLVREVVAAQLRGEARDQVLSVLTAALLRVYPKDGYRNSDSEFGHRRHGPGGQAGLLLLQGDPDQSARHAAGDRARNGDRQRRQGRPDERPHRQHRSRQGGRHLAVRHQPAGMAAAVITQAPRDRFSDFVTL
jgi:hypothetical protein